MNCTTITHAGSQWAKLCAACGLDPEQATAAQVHSAIRREALTSIADALTEFSHELLGAEIPRQHFDMEAVEAFGRLCGAVILRALVPPASVQAIDHQEAAHAHDV